MKEIIYNYDYLNKEDINNVVKRAKIIIINSQEEILFAHSNGEYHLSGGHLEENETFDECIVREVFEETGIQIKKEERKPYLSIKYYTKNYPNDNENTLYITNYYLVKSDLKPNLDILTLTENEKKGNFELKYININNVIEELEQSIEEAKNKNVTIDTIEAVKEYINMR